MKKIRKDAWTTQEDEIIKSKWNTSTKREEMVEMLPKRTWGAIERRITMLGIGGQKNRWKPEEDALLKERWVSTPNEELLTLFPNRTWNAIELRASIIGLGGQRMEIFKWNEKEIEILKSLWGKVKIEQVLAALPNRNKPSIYAKAAELELEGNASLAHQIYTRDETFFDTPNPLNSYYAGWIASDGCISPISENKIRIQIALQDRDVDMLDGFKMATKYTGPIEDIAAREPFKIAKSKTVSITRPQKRLQIYCKQWAQSLLRHWNITPAKSLTYIGPNSHGLENDLCFILGYIEGDGFIGVRNLNDGRVPYMGVCGNSKPSLQFINDLFNREFPSSKHSEINGDYKFDDTYRYHITGERAAAILRRLHTLPVPHLKRKWENPELLNLLYPNQQKVA